MLNVESWMKEYCDRLQEAFGDRIWFIGLQGSHARGEAGETSDIDAVCILDSLSIQDIDAYGNVLDSLPNRSLTCGFFGGREELLKWEPSELFQFYHDTIPYFGSLDCLLDVIDATTIDRAILQAACGVYHGCVHNMLFEKSEDILVGLYKATMFAVQASVYRETGCYVKCLDELFEKAAGIDREVIATRMALKIGGSVSFIPMSETILLWAQDKILKGGYGD